MIILWESPIEKKAYYLLIYKLRIFKTPISSQKYIDLSYSKAWGIYLKDAHWLLYEIGHFPCQDHAHK